MITLAAFDSIKINNNNSAKEQIMKKLLPIAVVVATTFAVPVTSFANNAEVNKQVRAIMKMEHRNEKDKKRDRNRNPVAALDFWGMTPEMKVIEFAPGSGWYTKILAPLLKDKGELHLAYKQEWLDGLKPLLKKKPLNKAVPMPIPLDWNNQEYRYELGDLDFGMTDADMVLNIREYHNFNLADKAKLNKAAFDALKPGGSYIIVDHSRRHMQPETKELGRREDPVKVILEVQSAGFVLDKSSDMFYRPDDELRYEVGRKSVTGNTDRFSLVFKKPK